jgi:hypothetical protein
VPIIVDLREDLRQYIQKHGLSKKWERVKDLFEKNPSHPSLKTEPRALSICLPDDKIEVIAVTKHYRK